jgi:2-phospho-L-lactate guanylyltransferase (CobY/MobA/RfbA family)
MVQVQVCACSATARHGSIARVLEALAEAHAGLSRCVVASAEVATLETAPLRGAMALADKPEAALNRALEGARTLARRNSADTLLVLAADMPDVSAAALRKLRGATPPGTAWEVAERHPSGTNGLLLRARCGLPFAFGAGSLARHHPRQSDFMPGRRRP